jgi:hypothetical protein
LTPRSRERRFDVDTENEESLSTDEPAREGINPGRGKDRRMHAKEDAMAISDKLAKIRNNSAALNKETDDLNETFGHVNDGLSGSGVTFWWGSRLLDERIMLVPDDDGVPRKERLYFLLGYAKVGDEWCLAVQSYEGRAGTDNYGHDEWDDVETREPAVPLTRASRAIRIEAADVLEPFLDALNDAIEQMRAKIAKARAVVSDEPTIETKPKRR